MTKKEKYGDYLEGPEHLPPCNLTITVLSNKNNRV